MGRDELMELVGRLRAEKPNLDMIHLEINALHNELWSISRKRSYFMEDTCAVVLKHCAFNVEYTDTDEKQKQDHALEVMMDFVEPLVKELSVASDTQEETDVFRQRGVLVAFLLFILGKINPGYIPEIIPQRLLIAIMTSGIELHDIFWTLRVREHLAKVQILEEDANSQQNILQKMGLSQLAYFLKDTEQEYLFSRWSTKGVIHLIVLTLVTHPQDAFQLPSDSPHGNLFAIAAASQFLLQDEQPQKMQGLQALEAILMKCPPSSLTLPPLRHDDLNIECKPSLPQSYDDYQCNDWISPLVQLITNAMLTFPKPTDRSFGLNVLRKLFQVLQIEDRFYLVQKLVIHCPYGNIAAILVDQLRADAVDVWSKSLSNSTPFTSPILGGLVLGLLGQANKRDLMLYADMVASTASLLRFIFICDKENRSGLMSGRGRGELTSVLKNLQQRLQDETQKSSYDDVDRARLLLIEAALESTIAVIINN